MSDQLLYFFLADTPTGADTSAAADEPALLWKVVLRTGTWKLRPGPGGVKLNAPLKIFRDKAPKGHISLTSLKNNFEAGAKEYVTVPQVHADGTVSDGGFVKKLVIQDVPGEDGSGVKESLLWAGMEITDSALKKKLDEKSIRGVSGGILFDYQRTEDAKKFDQVMSHVMVTNSPWIGGTGDFTDKLPEGVMASEPDDLPVGELEFDANPMMDPPDQPDPTKVDGPPAGEVVWKPEEGYQFARGQVQKALDDWRRAVLASLPKMSEYSYSDFPSYYVEDIADGKAMVHCGYGTDRDAWVVGFKLGDNGVVIDPFQNWTPAKQEWVAASEDPVKPQSSPSRPADLPPVTRPISLQTAGLREAQAIRAEHLGVTHNTKPGGPMGRISDLLPAGVELSDEQREAIRREEERVAALEASEERNRATARESETATYLTELATKIGLKAPDGETDPAKSLDPALARYVRSVLTSDDGGPAIELSEVTETGQRTAPVARTASDILKGFIDALPKSEEGHVTLSQQARRMPNEEPPPPANNNDSDDEKSAREKADAWLSEARAQGLDLGVPVPSQNGGK